MCSYSPAMSFSEEIDGENAYKSDLRLNLVPWKLGHIGLKNAGDFHMEFKGKQAINPIPNLLTYDIR